MKIKCLKQPLQLAHDYGICSIRQLILFLDCAANEGQSLKEILEKNGRPEDLLKERTRIRQLTGGDGRSNRKDGAGLLCSDGHRGRKATPVKLSKKGKELSALLKDCF